MDKDGGRSITTSTPTKNETDSFLNNLKIEWKLFWHGILGDDDNADGPIGKEQLQNLTKEQIKQISRALSQDRKRLNQNMEAVQKEIDSLTENLESQKLVGADTSETLVQIQKLMDLGHQLSQQLEKINNQITNFRKREEELKK